MAGEKFLKQVSGTLTEVISVQTGGGGNANKIPALDAAGLLDVSMMPSGIGADTASILASEALSAGNLVNIYDSTGVATVRKADATSPGKEANGFVLAAVTSGGMATVYFEGSNTQMTGLTAGQNFLATTPGGSTVTPPSASGNIVQAVGIAVSATVLNCEFQRQIILA